ncbi:MAG: DUF2150 family protein [Methermicoccaceae archaeon]
MSDDTEEVHFYTPQRWENWIKTLNEEFKEWEGISDDKAGEISLNMQEDVVISCLKIIKSVKNKRMSKKKARMFLDDINNIVLETKDGLHEDVAIILESVQISLLAVIRSCIEWLGKPSTKLSLDELIDLALSKEEEGDVDGALEAISTLGARVISGESMPDIEDIPYSMVVEWLEGIEVISENLSDDV